MVDRETRATWLDKGAHDGRMHHHPAHLRCIQTYVSHEEHASAYEEIRESIKLNDDFEFEEAQNHFHKQEVINVMKHGKNKRITHHTARICSKREDEILEVF